MIELLVAHELWSMNEFSFVVEHSEQWYGHGFLFMQPVFEQVAAKGLALCPGCTLALIYALKPDQSGSESPLFGVINV
jgi:hypothetical protein